MENLFSATTCSYVVFAKVPEAGTAKTGIITTDGKEKAAEVYKELLAHTARTMAEIPYHLAYTDHEDPLSLTSLFTTARSFFPQTGTTPGERLRNAFTHLFKNGLHHVIAISTDCPALESHDIVHACKLITAGIDIVIGPAQDGDYYLIGCDKKGLAVFDAAKWGTSDQFEETLAIMNRNNLSYYLLHTLSNIDSIEDYLKWKRSKQS